MSTSEVFLQAAQCPCGAGTVSRTFYSPNNPYSKCWTDRLKINCTVCQDHWKFLSLIEDVLIPAETPYAVKESRRFTPDWQYV
jgi:hypothetical protein